MKPTSNERTAKLVKLPKILKGNENVTSAPGLANLTTVSKSMILTASLVIPSPNTKLKSLGYYS